MINEITQQVYYADTDAYGVVWHGSYIRFFEIGRCAWCDDAGVDLIDLDKTHNIMIPVVNLNIRYKCSARLGDKMIISTFLKKITSLSATFVQKITSPDGRTFIEATIEIVAVNREGKLYRQIPEVLAKRMAKYAIE
jgi:acyl-CoA thioester hydrolase